jgi:L-alanine-DL-glutamate epimerase-like enolase superfamily enzyme
VSHELPTWQRLAELPLTIERCELQPLRVALSPQFERVTTVVHLHGGGCHGVGEDVVYDAVDHQTLLDGPPPPLPGSYTLRSFSAHLSTLDLFPQPPQHEVSRRYRTWAFESAALDLALALAGTTLHQALAIDPSPLRFVVSLRLGEPPSLAPLLARLQIAPDMRFKLDPTPSWDRQLIASLVELRAVDSVDLKGCYEGTIVDNPPDPRLYREVAEAFPHAWIEDPRLGPQTEAALEGHLERVTWDAPIHEVADIQALARKPRCINVKPSRIGRIADLLAVYRHCEQEGISCYGGGQSELGPGRGQIQYLASLFHPRTANDVAPSGWNLSQPPKDLLPSPLPPTPSDVGFRWAA